MNFHSKPRHLIIKTRTSAECWVFTKTQIFEEIQRRQLLTPQKQLKLQIQHFQARLELHSLDLSRIQTVFKTKWIFKHLARLSTNRMIQSKLIPRSVACKWNLKFQISSWVLVLKIKRKLSYKITKPRLTCSKFDQEKTGASKAKEKLKIG